MITFHLNYQILTMYSSNYIRIIGFLDAKKNLNANGTFVFDFLRNLFMNFIRNKIVKVKPEVCKASFTFTLRPVNLDCDHLMLEFIVFLSAVRDLCF